MNPVFNQEPVEVVEDRVDVISVVGGGEHSHRFFLVDKGFPTIKPK